MPRVKRSTGIRYVEKHRDRKRRKLQPPIAANRSLAIAMAIRNKIFSPYGSNNYRAKNFLISERNLAQDTELLNYQLRGGRSLLGGPALPTRVTANSLQPGVGDFAALERYRASQRAAGGERATLGSGVFEEDQRRRMAVADQETQTQQFEEAIGESPVRQQQTVEGIPSVQSPSSFAGPLPLETYRDIRTPSSATKFPRATDKLLARNIRPEPLAGPNGTIVIRYAVADESRVATRAQTATFGQTFPAQLISKGQMTPGQGAFSVLKWFDPSDNLFYTQEFKDFGEAQTKLPFGTPIATLSPGAENPEDPNSGAARNLTQEFVASAQTPTAASKTIVTASPSQSQATQAYTAPQDASSVIVDRLRSTPGIEVEASKAGTIRVAMPEIGERMTAILGQFAIALLPDTLSVMRRAAVLQLFAERERTKKGQQFIVPEGMEENRLLSRFATVARSSMAALSSTIKRQDADGFLILKPGGKTVLTAVTYRRNALDYADNFRGTMKRSDGLKPPSLAETLSHVRQTEDKRQMRLGVPHTDRAAVRQQFASGQLSNVPMRDFRGGRAIDRARAMRTPASQFAYL